MLGVCSYVEQNCTVGGVGWWLPSVVRCGNITYSKLQNFWLSALYIRIKKEKEMLRLVPEKPWSYLHKVLRAYKAQWHNGWCYDLLCKRITYRQVPKSCFQVFMHGGKVQKSYIQAGSLKEMLAILSYIRHLKMQVMTNHVTPSCKVWHDYTTQTYLWKQKCRNRNIGNNNLDTHVNGEDWWLIKTDKITSC